MSIYYTKITAFVKQKLKICHLKDSLRSYKIYCTPAENGYEHARFPFFVLESCGFRSESPRILLMAKRQKTQEAVHIPFLLRTIDFVMR